MCLVAFFFLALLFAFMKLPFLTMTRPLLTFSLLNEENTPLVHTAKFKTWALLLPSRLCSLVNKTPCFIALSWIFTELFANGFPPVSVVYHFFFSLYLICGWMDLYHQNLHIYHNLFIFVTLWHMKTLHGVFSTLLVF